MYFNSPALITLLSDPARAEAAAPVIAESARRFTSPVAVIETIAALPALSVEEVEDFLDLQGIELRDMPPGHRMITAAVSALAEGSPRLLDAACADYYECETFLVPDAVQG